MHACSLKLTTSRAKSNGSNLITIATGVIFLEIPHACTQLTKPRVTKISRNKLNNRQTKFLGLSRINKTLFLSPKKSPSVSPIYKRSQRREWWEEKTSPCPLHAFCYKTIISLEWRTWKINWKTQAIYLS